MPDEYTLKFKVEVTIDPTEWAAEWADEYVMDQPIEDAREYLPALLEVGLHRQKEWGVVTNVAITNIGDSE